MTIEYGFNCICGAEYDLSPGTAESISGFTCKRCGRVISTGFETTRPTVLDAVEPSRPTVSDAVELTLDERYQQMVDPSRKVKIDRRENGVLEKASLKWETSKVPGERVDCQVVLRRVEESNEVGWDVEYFAAPFEGRHMTREYHSRFDRYSEAVKQCLSFVPTGTEGVARLKARLLKDL